MNARKSIFILAAAAALAVPGLSFADPYPSNPERSYDAYTDQSTGTLARADAVKDGENFRRDPISNDGLYRYAGPEAGWRLIPHTYAVEGGQLVHTNALLHEYKGLSRVALQGGGRQGTREVISGG